MAVLRRLPRTEIAASFTHRGWFVLCPVYLAFDGPEGLVMQERNGVPAWWLEVNASAQQWLMTLISAVDPFYEPRWTVLVTGSLSESANGKPS